MARLIALALVSALVQVVLPATGQAAGETDQVKANEIYKKAKEFFDNNDFQKAFELAQQAERMFAHPAITFLKARALRKLGRLREADEAFKSADSPQLPKPMQRPLSDERLALAEEFRVKGQLRINIEPESANLTLDGEPIKSGYDRWVLTGKRRVEATSTGYKPMVRVAEVLPGETATLNLRLVKLGGQLVVIVPGGLRGVDVSLDGGTVEIPDGNRVGDRAPSMPVGAGSHEIVCVRGDKRVKKTVQVEIDATAEVECNGLEPAGAATPVNKYVGWGGVAAGTAMFGYGMWGIASYYTTDVNDPRGVNDSLDKPWYVFNKRGGGAFYALTGAAGGVLSYLLFVREGGEARKAARAPATPGEPQAFAGDVSRVLTGEAALGQVKASETLSY